jgi:endonuclease YncB( thermonuclease family)
MSIFRLVAALAVLSTVAVAAPSRSVAVRVIDGDTFDFAGERIRILDIDTPE